MRNLLAILFLLVGCQTSVSPAQPVPGAAADSIFQPGKTYTLFPGNSSFKVVKTRSDGWFLAETEGGAQVWINAASLTMAVESVDPNATP